MASRELGIRPATVRVPFSMANREAFRSAKEEGEPFEFRTRLKAEIIRAAIGATTALATVLLAGLRSDTNGAACVSEAPEFLGGAGLNLESEVGAGNLQQFFLLHGSALTALREHWSAQQICFHPRKAVPQLPQINFKSNLNQLIKFKLIN